MIDHPPSGHPQAMNEAALAAPLQAPGGLFVAARSDARGAEPTPESSAGQSGASPSAWPRSAASEARLRSMVSDHYDFIWRSLRRLGVPNTDVDDCAQQVFWVAARKLDLITQGSERAFLFSTALRVASDARRSRVRRREVPQEDDARDTTCDSGPHPDEVADRKRARELLDEVLAAMPLDLRTVFVLFELEEMATQDIATLLEIPTGTVASRLRRAREEFHKLVARLKHGMRFQQTLAAQAPSRPAPSARPPAPRDMLRGGKS